MPKSRRYPQKMERLDWMIYFVPQLLTADAYLRIIEDTPELLRKQKNLKKQCLPKKHFGGCPAVC